MADSLPWDLLGAPLLAALIVLSTHVPLGRQVLARGIIFIDLAIAQLVGLGVIAVHALWDGPSALLIQLAAFAAALAGAVLLQWAERRWAHQLEALIGVLFVLAVSSALLLLHSDPHGGERLRELLVGQLLWVSWSDLWLPGLIALAVCVAWWRWHARSSSWLFYGLFAVAITSAVQLVGVYLVFASLIIPALGAWRRSLGAAYALGAAGYLLGLLASLWWDLPTGPTVVWALALVAMGLRALPRASTAA